MIRSLGLCILFCSPVLWACPTQSDLKTGIRIHFDDGTWNVYKHKSEDTLTEAAFTEDAKIDYMYDLYAGILETRYVEAGSSGGMLGEATRYTYDFAKEPLLSPKAGLRLAGQQTMHEKGYDDEAIPYSIEFRDQRRLKIGACSYATLPTRVIYQHPDETEIVSMQFLPELGLSFVVESRVGEDRDRYRPTKIERVK